MASGAQFEAVLRQVVAAERDDLVDELAKGAAEDYADYSARVAYIRALDQLPEWCAEAGKRLDER
jgi:hypothetical protein